MKTKIIFLFIYLTLFVLNSIQCSSEHTGKEGKAMFFLYGEKADSIVSLKSIFTPSEYGNKIGITFTIVNTSNNDQSYRAKGFVLIDNKGSEISPTTMVSEEFFTISRGNKQELFLVFDIDKNTDIRDINFSYKDKETGKVNYKVALSPQTVQLDDKIRPASSELHYLLGQSENNVIAKYGSKFRIVRVDPGVEVTSNYNISFSIQNYYNLIFSIKNHKITDILIVYFNPIKEMNDSFYKELIAKYKNLGFTIYSLKKETAQLENGSMMCTINSLPAFADVNWKYSVYIGLSYK